MNPQEELQDIQNKFRILQGKYKKQKQEKSFLINSHDDQIRQLRRGNLGHMIVFKKQYDETFERLSIQRQQTEENLKIEVQDIKKQVHKYQLLKKDEHSREYETLNDNFKENKYEQEHKIQQINELQQQASKTGEELNLLKQNQYSQKQSHDTILQREQLRIDLLSVEVEEQKKEKQKFQTQLEQTKQKFQTQLEQTTQQISQKNQDNQQLREELEREKINNNEISEKLQLSKDEITVLISSQQQQKDECNKLNSQLIQTQQELQDSHTSISTLNVKLEKGQKDYNEAQEMINDLTQANDDLIQKNEQLIKKSANQQEQFQVQAENQQFQVFNLKSKIESYQEDQKKINKYKQDWENIEGKFKSQLEVERKERRGLSQILASKRSKTQLEQLQKGISGPIESLFKLGNIKEILNREGVFPNIQNYKISLIKINEDQFKQKLTNISNLNLDECYSYEFISSISCKGTVGPVTNGDRQDVSLIEVQEDPTNTFNGQIFAIKDSKIDRVFFKDAGSAIKSVTGNLIAKYLMEQYVKNLKKSMPDLQSEPKYMDLYLLEAGPELEEKKFQICEKIEDGKFQKYNGNGKFEENAQYAEVLNGYTQFSYAYSKKQVLVSYVQGVELIMYDPVVSTEDGILDDNDYGYDEIVKSVQGLRSGVPEKMGQRFCDIAMEGCI